MTDKLKREIDAKVRYIKNLQPGGDPALSDHASLIASTVRVIQAAEGWLIAKTLPETLAIAPHLTVVAQPKVALPERALELADTPDTTLNLEYTGEGRVRHVDQLVLDHDTGAIEFTECKRGFKPIGADHRRTRMRDDIALQFIGRSYAWHRFRTVATTAVTRTVSYYGNTGLPDWMTINAYGLDEHYRYPVQAAIEGNLAYFRAALEREIPGLTKQ